MHTIDYAIQRAFFRFIIWQLKVDHRIGRSTGRNPDDLHQTKQDISKWEGELHKLEVRQCFSS